MVLTTHLITDCTVISVTDLIIQASPDINNDIKIINISACPRTPALA